MASSLLGGPTPPPLLSSPLKTKTRPPPAAAASISSLCPPIQLQHPKLCCSLSLSNTLCLRSRKFLAVLAVVDKETVITEEINHVREKIDDFELKKKQAKPCELYVCNLPRSSDIADLVEMFKPFGSVLSVEVSITLDLSFLLNNIYVRLGSIKKYHF
jgi:polyadenylate-binding protein